MNASRLFVYRVLYDQTLRLYGWGFEPRVGDAVLWWNVKENGKEDLGTLHAGDPVLAGEKWALNIWLRQRPRRDGGGNVAAA